MSGDAEGLLEEMAQVAASLGQALRPIGHEELLRSIADAARHVFAAEACSIALLDEDTDELVFEIVTGKDDGFQGTRVANDAGIAGWIVESGQPMAITDVRNDARFARDVAESSGYVPNTILAMPLETERRALGVIEVLDANPPGSDIAAGMQLLEVFARQAALAIESSRVFADFGRALFASAAVAATGTGLQAAFEQVATTARRPERELAELAGVFHELNRLGPKEARLAVRLVRDVLDHVR